MSAPNTPIARISVRRKEGDSYRSYSVLTVWTTKFDGLITASLDKGSEKYPAMGLLDAIKAVAAGASVEIRTSQTKPQGRPSHNLDGFGSRGNESFGGGGDVDDIPFAPFNQD